MPVERSQIIQFVRSIYLFKKADDAACDLLASSLQSTDFYQGEIIFNQDDPAANLYFLFKGKVRLTRYKKDEEESMGLLEEGDVFGFEMLEYDSLCKARATAQTDVTVLWLDRDHARQVLENIPTLNLDLKLVFESYLLSLNTRFAWRNEDEVIYFLARRHIFFLLRRYVPIFLFSIITFPLIAILAGKFSTLSTPIILAVVDVLVILLWSVWSYLDWSNDYAVITNQRVAFIEKVILLYDSREEAPLNAVLSVTTGTDYWGRVLGFGDVLAKTYAGVIKLSRIAYPTQASFILTAEWDRVKSQRLQVEKSELEETIRKKLGYTKEETPPEVQKSSPAAPVGSVSIRDRLLQPFRLRFVKGDVVTWRTHWLLLVRKLVLPTLIFLGMIALVVVRLFGILSFLSILATVGLAVVFMFISALWWLYNFLDWSNDIYIVTADQVIDIDQKPLGQMNRKAAPLKSVQSIEYERLGIIGLLFNYGTVYINVGETTLTFDEVLNPAEVQRELFKHMAARDYNEKHAQMEATQNQVAEWIAIYHKITEEERKLKNPLSPNTN